jgi:hypothetical protein
MATVNVGLIGMGWIGLDDRIRLGGNDVNS